MNYRVFYLEPNGGVQFFDLPFGRFSSQNNILCVVDELGRLVDPEFINLSPMERVYYGQPNQIEMLTRLGMYESPNRVVLFSTIEKYLTPAMHENGNFQSLLVKDRAGYRTGFQSVIDANGSGSYYFNIPSELMLLPFRFRMWIKLDAVDAELVHFVLEEVADFDDDLIFNDYISSTMDTLQGEVLSELIPVKEPFAMFGRKDRTNYMRRFRISVFNSQYTDPATIEINPISLIFNA